MVFRNCVLAEEERVVDKKRILLRLKVSSFRVYNNDCPMYDAKAHVSIIYHAPSQKE